jgi:hypothetical protein
MLFRIAHINDRYPILSHSGEAGLTTSLYWKKIFTRQESHPLVEPPGQGWRSGSWGIFDPHNLAWLAGWNYGKRLKHPTLLFSYRIYFGFRASNSIPYIPSIISTASATNLGHSLAERPFSLTAAIPCGVLMS